MQDKNERDSHGMPLRQFRGRRVDPDRSADPKDADDTGYARLEAEAAQTDDEAMLQAERFDEISADEGIDERVESAAPSVLEVPTPSGDDLEVMIREAPGNEREPAMNADQPLARAPDELQPETGEHSLGDLSYEGNWPDEEGN